MIVDIYVDRFILCCFGARHLQLSLVSEHFGDERWGQFKEFICCQDPPNLQAGPPEKRLFADPPEAPKPKDKGKEKGKGKGSAVFF